MLDLSNVLPGNSINLTYTDTATNTPHQITIVRVDDPTALPLPNTAASPNDKVIGVNFQGGMASIVSQLTAAVGNTNLQFSNPSGSTLRVLDNGAGGGQRQCGIDHGHDVGAGERQSATAGVHRRQHALYRRDHRPRRRSRPDLRGASRSMPRWSAIPRSSSSTTPRR